MEPRLTLTKRIGPASEWTVEMSWQDNDQHGPSHLVIRPTEPDSRPAAGLSQTVLREVDFAVAVEEMRATGAPDAGAAPEIDWNTAGSALAKLSSNGLNDLYLAMLSIVYCAITGGKRVDGNDLPPFPAQPKPVEYLADITGKSPAAIKSHLWHATRKGFLIRSSGRRGGQFTSKATQAVSDSVKSPT